MKTPYETLAKIFKRTWARQPSDRPKIEEFRDLLDETLEHDEQSSSNDNNKLISLTKNHNIESGGDTGVLLQPSLILTDLPNDALDADEPRSVSAEVRTPISSPLLDEVIGDSSIGWDVTALNSSQTDNTVSVFATVSHTNMAAPLISSMELTPSQVEVANETGLQDNQLPPTDDLARDHLSEEVIGLQEPEALSIPESSQNAIQLTAEETPVASTSNRGTMRSGLSASMTQPHPVGVDSPRTIRLRMLASELPEDLRRDLLWERKTNRIHPHNTEASPIPTRPEISS
jgi:hypothetical protein